LSPHCVLHSGIPVASAETRCGDIMLIRDCNSVAEVFGEVLDLVRRDRAQFDDGSVMYYFRGENRNIYGGDDVPNYPSIPGICRKEKLLDNEAEIYNEALRAFPEEFARDRTTFERLSRMQHYGYPTRLLDVSPKLMTALGMVRSLGDSADESVKSRNGFVRVYRVRDDRIKYGTSDTVTALSNLARIKRDHVRIEDLQYLTAECKNERAGFFWEKGSKTTDALERDIQKVWCVRPMVNNIRLNFQAGEFFLFGCHDNKRKLEVTFHENEYDDEHSPTYGIAEIATIVVTSAAKKELDEFAECLDIGDERLYPDFAHHSKWIQNKFKEEN